MSERHPAIVKLLSFFAYAHLPEHLQAGSKPFAELAEHIANDSQSEETLSGLRALAEHLVQGPQNAETTAALAKLAQLGEQLEHGALHGASLAPALRLLLEAKDCAVRARL